MKQLALMAALLTLAACASAPTAQSGDRIDWRCDGGAAFSMRYTAQGVAEVFAGGQVYNLPAVESGSGTRYTNGAVDYREHQGQATLGGATGGPYTNCRRG